MLHAYMCARGEGAHDMEEQRRAMSCKLTVAYSDICNARAI